MDERCTRTKTIVVYEAYLYDCRFTEVWAKSTRGLHHEIMRPSTVQFESHNKQDSKGTVFHTVYGIVANTPRYPRLHVLPSG